MKILIEKEAFSGSVHISIILDENQHRFEQRYASISPLFWQRSGPRSFICDDLRVVLEKKGDSQVFTMKTLQALTRAQLETRKMVKIMRKELVGLRSRKKFEKWIEDVEFEKIIEVK